MSASRDLTGHLLQFDDDKLRRLERREADDDIDDAEIDVVLRRGFFVALYEVSIARRGALKRPLAKQIVHERAQVEADLRPQRLIVGLENDPVSAAIKAFLDEQRECGAPGCISIPRRADRRLAVSGRPKRLARPPAWRADNSRPSGLSSPFSRSVNGTLSCGTPTSVASNPAGAFQTPRWLSVREKIPPPRRKEQTPRPDYRAVDWAV